jgi:pimeloyl-ACP methyl ester carboxylesterase
VFLHGFPEFWYGWKWVMDELAGEFRLVVPDQRGYNLSDKPAELEAYHITKLVGDIVGLIDALDTGKVILVAHDWGGVVAWALGAAYPELLDKLVILNAPHPQVFARELAENPEQQAASTYITWFMNEGFEDTLAANDFAFLVGTVFNDSFTEQDKAAYKAAWGQPGALKAGLNWYRANFVDGTPSTGEVIIDKVPTLVLWGMKDTALLPGNLVGLDEYVTDLTIQKFEDATHWIAHEEAAGVAQAIREFVNSSE